VVTGVFVLANCGVLPGEGQGPRPKVKWLTDDRADTLSAEVDGVRHVVATGVGGFFSKLPFTSFRNRNIPEFAAAACDSCWINEGDTYFLIQEPDGLVAHHAHYDRVGFGEPQYQKVAVFSR